MRKLESIPANWKKSVTLAIRLDKEADTRLCAMARKLKCSRGEVVRRMIRAS